MKQCVIIGAGTYGQVYSEYLKSKYEVIGFIDDDPLLKNQVVAGIRVIGDRYYLFSELSRTVSVFVPIGNNKIRVELLSKLLSEGFDIPSFVHDTVVFHESVVFGKANYILPCSSIMPSTVIKDFVMISMGVNIAHHVIIEEGCFFSQGVNVGASIHIGEKAYLGIAATVMTGVKSIGASALLGAGTVVIQDMPDYAVIVGNPGKIIRYSN